MQLWDEIIIDLEVEDFETKSVKLFDVQEDYDENGFDVSFKKAFWIAENKEFSDDDLDAYTDKIKDEIKDILASY